MLQLSIGDLKSGVLIALKISVKCENITIGYINLKCQQEQAQR